MATTMAIAIAAIGTTTVATIVATARVAGIEMQLIAIPTTTEITPTLHLPAAVAPTAHHQGALVAAVAHQAVVPLALLQVVADKSIIYSCVN